MAESTPTVVTPVPALSVYQDAVGNIAFSGAIPPSTSAVNWTGILQWLTTYGPNVIAAFAALIALFGSPTPAPPAPTVPPHEVKP
jgi:hypothetical protein